MIRVLLCHEQPLVRTGLRTVLTNEPDLRLIGDYDAGDAAAGAIPGLAPDVLLASLACLGYGTGRLVDAASRNPVPVIVLAGAGEKECVERALRTGARGFILDDDPVEQIAYAIRSVAAGHALLSPEVTSGVIAGYTGRAPRTERPDLHELLSPRELDVLRLLATGEPVARIAKELFVAEVTVRSHIHHLLRKLGLTRSFQAVALAYHTGLVDPLSTVVEPAPALVNGSGADSTAHR
ncbi:LuxR C-terminal-related transcriptional regulator [Amycolatopsis sp. CA-230715]|uniref:LuxR C-terminal-related transcriptional regulator n=1 Tax=Amycolatopsis sp. CA-230715 TaxID=2745196 RepID=UPI001C02B1D8|nr:response regulator transcription factor [Amycolatopsis sp. CA-230715]QWF84063.1 Transcriptional regulatory protein DegU [Amycolatopsis sp. CA-230715]